MSIGHIIFDCDGVLIDSEPLSMQVDIDLLHENGITISAADAHQRFVGLTFEAMIGMMEEESGRKFPANLSAEKDRRLLALYEAELRPVPGIVAALEAIALPVSVASNSPFDRIVEALRITRLSRFFGTRITTFEHVKHGKPAPDIFIEAARRAASAPGHCLVIEDSVTGVTSAVSAGCRVFGFTGTHHLRADHAGRLEDIGAELVFDRMADLPGLLATLR